MDLVSSIAALVVGLGHLHGDQETSLREWLSTNETTWSPRDLATQSREEERHVVIGESVHGSSDLFQVFEAMASELLDAGCLGRIALEVDVGQGVALDGLVRSRSSVGSSSLERLSQQYQTEEFLAFLRKLQEWNLANVDRQVGILGFDVQEPRAGLLAVAKELRSMNAGLAAELAKVAKELRRPILEGERCINAPSEERAARIAQLLSESEEALSSTKGTREPLQWIVEATRSYLRVVQSEDCCESREACMSKILERILEDDEGGVCLLHMHETHMAASGGSRGALARVPKGLQGRVLRIECVCGSGRLVAYNPVRRRMESVDYRPTGEFDQVLSAVQAAAPVQCWRVQGSESPCLHRDGWRTVATGVCTDEGPVQWSVWHKWSGFADVLVYCRECRPAVPLPNAGQYHDQ